LEWGPTGDNAERNKGKTDKTGSGLTPTFKKKKESKLRAERRLSRTQTASEKKRK